MDTEVNPKEEDGKAKERQALEQGLSDRVVRLEKEIQYMNAEICAVRDLVKELLRQQESLGR